MFVEIKTAEEKYPVPAAFGRVCPGTAAASGTGEVQGRTVGGRTMKLLTITVPCYNSASYMEKCIESLLIGGEDVKILIVNDGSTKDNTAEIADRYAKAYPSIVRAIHQENKGHGGAVNTGLANATGLYFKVVDSDDWLNEEAYRRVLAALKEAAGGPETLDMMISDYVYEKEGAEHKRVMKYTKALPQERIFTWDEAKSLGKSHYLLMHSLIYRTKLFGSVN